MFVVECNPDFVLVSSLISISKKKIEHASGKARVIRKLMRNFENSIGMVDEDPHSTTPSALKKFREIEFLDRYKIKILYHSQRRNRLVVLCPKLEEWIVEAGKEANVNLNNYNLPSDPIELHKIINIRTKEFHKLIEDLSKTSPRIKALHACLKPSNSH